MLDLSPERFVYDFSAMLSGASEPETLKKAERGLVVASCVVAMEHNQSTAEALYIFQQGLATQELGLDPVPSYSQWRNSIRVIGSNLGPTPVPVLPREVLLCLRHDILDYEDMSRARHPSARTA